MNRNDNNESSLEVILTNFSNGIIKEIRNEALAQKVEMLNSITHIIGKFFECLDSDIDDKLKSIIVEIDKKKIIEAKLAFALPLLAKELLGVNVEVEVNLTKMKTQLLDHSKTFVSKVKS